MIKTKPYLIVLLLLSSILIFIPSVSAVPITVTTNDATNVEELTATLNGVLTNGGGETCTVRFEYGLTTSYGTNTSNQSKTIGQTFSANIAGLTYGKLYHYRTFANNSVNSSVGSDKTFLTKPNTPNATFYFIGTEQVNISWNKTEVGANNTVIIWNTTSYPTSLTDGTEIYNGTANYFNYVLNPSYDYYLSLWSYSSSDSLHQYSDNYLEMQLTGLQISCYNEVTFNDITFNVKLSNINGSQVYENTGCTNPHIINASLCPQGNDIQIIVSATGYYTRIYTMDILDERYYINTFLPPTSNTSVYTIRVIEVVETEYSPYERVVENALITIKKYVNTSGIYETVYSLYTDASGYIHVYLQSLTDYKVFINKTGYNETISNYIPQPPNEYGQTDMKTFTINRIYTPPVIIPSDTVFTNIVVTISPLVTRHTEIFTFYFNITSSDNQLEWYRLRVYYRNNTGDVWDFISTETGVNAGGGSLDYTIPDVKGEYRFVCVYKKDGFPLYEVGQTGSIIHFYVAIRTSLASIPDYAWYIITIVVMMAGMGFFTKYFGANIIVGYIGLGIFAMMLMLKDFSVDIGTSSPISGWAILGITFLVYTMGVFLYSRL